MKRCLLLGCCLLVVVFAGAGCKSQTQEEIKPKIEHPPMKEVDAARESVSLFEQKCSQCHTLERVNESYKTMSKDQMREIIERMRTKTGAQIQQDQVDAILYEIYGTTAPGESP